MALSFKRFLPAVWAAAALAAAALSWFRTFELYELQTYDWRCVIRGPREIVPDIALVEISDDALEQFGAWPFSRLNHAVLIEILAAYGARSVALDMVFVEPEKPDQPFEGSTDEAVCEAIRAAGNVYLAEAFGLTGKHGGGRFEADERLAPLMTPYSDAAKAIVHVNSKADLDGKRRRVQPAVVHEGKTYFQLSFRIAMDLLGVNPEDVRFVRGGIDLGGKAFLPLDQDGYFLVNYAGTWKKTFEHYSYLSVIASQFQKESGRKTYMELGDLKGKVCIVGLTALASHDIGATPLEPVYPLVGMHANVLNSILRGDFIRRAGRPANLAILAVFAAWVLFLSARFRPWKAFTLFLGTSAVFVVFAVLLFSFAGIWIDLFYPGLLLAVLYAGATLRRVMHEMRKRELIEGELKIASQIQKSFLPETLPQGNGVDIAVFMKPAKAVGGDLYSFVALKDGRLGLMAGDVSGKGTPAALFMAKTVSEFKFSARDEESPSLALSRLNDSISAESTGGLFVTVTYAIFDVRARTLRLSNAGHLPVVRVAPDGSTELVTAEEGMPIGVFPGAEFLTKEIPLAPGECFAFYSDGVSEARNRRKDEYGVEALQKTMVDNRTKPAAGILESAVLDLNRFMGKAEQHDDITLIVVKVGEAA